MKPTPEKRKKQRAIRGIIILCGAIAIVLAYLQSSLLKGSMSLPFPGNIIIFSLININVLLLLLMIFLILRNLVEVIFEKKQNIIGSKLKSRLVLSFIAFALIPTALLFIISMRFISTSMEYWFKSSVEEALASSIELAQTIYRDSEQQSKYIGAQTAKELENYTNIKSNIDYVKTKLSKQLYNHSQGGPDSFILIDHNNNELLRVEKDSLQQPSAMIPDSLLNQVRNRKTALTINNPNSDDELIQTITPVNNPETNQELLLITGILIPRDKLQLMQEVSRGMNEYKQLMVLKSPIKFNTTIILLVTILLIIFGAIWFGFYFARTLTVPINKLALATRRVARGDLEFTLSKESDDEMGMLVDSFNTMTQNLLKGNRKLALANKALQEESNISEQRRQYLETILKSVAAGVITIDEEGVITTINPFAIELLRIKKEDFLNHNFREVMARPHVHVMEGFLKELENSKHNSIERHIRLTIRPGQTLSLMLNITRMHNDEQKAVGHVIVFDNLTNLEKAQRLAAWQEVARRIAHEIKNPLTPIQLSAQRLRKKYLKFINKQDNVFDQCTATIITQVDEIKKLVSEFSEFARMPKVSKQKSHINDIIESTLVLYREAHKHISFSFAPKQQIAPFAFDPVQIKRVIINMLDNSVNMIAEKGEITIHTEKKENKVLIMVIDDGPGVDDKIKPRLFEPYFSTSKSGTGLGLAIAQTIINEHKGKIWVSDNLPTGSIFTIELPFVT